MQLASVVDTCLAGIETIGRAGLELGLIGIRTIVRALPQRHLGVLGHLTVDCPGFTVVVRIGLACLRVPIGHHLEPQLGADPAVACRRKTP